MPSRPRSRFHHLLFVALAAVCLPSGAGVVINEIMYHAPGELDDLQYVELHNPGKNPVDVGGWSFSKGIRYTFARGSQVAPGGFLIVCRDEGRFREFYGDVPVAGVFEAALKRKGERLELVDSKGRLVETVRFRDDAPWPAGADGESGSLERISPAGPAEDPGNWTSSPLAPDRVRPGGTPGRPNAGYSPGMPPAILRVTQGAEILEPGLAVPVEAAVASDAEVAGMDLLYRVVAPGAEGAEASVAMVRTATGRYRAEVPGQAAGSLLRFRVRARGNNGAVRFFPAETDPRPALSAYVATRFTAGSIPFLWVLHSTEAEREAARGRINPRPFFGFGAPFPRDPEADARAEARKQLEEDMDLSGVWFELTVRQEAGNPAAVQRLRSAFLDAEARRGTLIEELLAGPDLEARLPSVPGVVRGYLQEVSATLERVTPGETHDLFNDWLARRGTQPVAGAGMIVSRADLEAAWHAITLNANPSADRFPALREAVVRLVRERDALVEEVAAGKGRETLFRDQRVRAEALGGRIPSELSPLLDAGGVAALDQWRSGPRELAVGFRGPALRSGPPPRFAGGPPFGGRPGGGRDSGDAESPASHNSAVVYYDPATGATRLFDFVQVSGRKGGQKIHFAKDRPLDGMTSVNVIFEGATEAVVEPLAYEVYRRAGMPAERAFHVRLWQDGEPAGYQLLVEQPNRAFLRAAGLNDDGHLYKLIWYGDGIEGQHEKKTRIREGHRALTELVAQLDRTSGDGQWEVIRRHFDVDEVATYFAVNLVLSHWDGFFNNYFAYEDSEGTGKWSLYPWDQDSTWGLRTMGPPGDGPVFFDMAVTFGMNGDVPPPDGGWWRGPGWFSGPLLANPQFRVIYLKRVRDILEGVYTEAAFGPYLAAMEERLTPEVRLRAEVLNQDPEAAVEAFRNDLRRCREHLRLRREFLLSQEEIRRLGSGGPAAPGAR